MGKIKFILIYYVFSMPIIASLVLELVLPLLGDIFALLRPVLGALIKFSLSRIPKIPSYLRLLKFLYSDMDSSVKERKIITTGLLVIGSIVTFMAYSLIPLTGIPLIGAITSSIAAAVAITIALAVLDVIFTTNEGYYRNRLHQQGFAGLDDIDADIKSLKNIFGKSWRQVVSMINNASQKIETEQINRGINTGDRSYQKYVDERLDRLNSYIGEKSAHNYEAINSHLLMQANGQDWTKEAFSAGTSATVGILSGLGASAVTSSIFAQAGILTTLQGLVGASTGVVVSASTYSLLTLAAPVGLTVLTGVGIYSSLKERQNQEASAKKSKFLSEIMLCALPMAWIDGKLTQQERDTIDRFITTSGMRQEERECIWNAMEKRQTFDEIMRKNIIFHEEHRQQNCLQSDEERLKHRLVLCMAWQIAVADDSIDNSELALHNQMAYKLGISSEEVKEIRRAIEISDRKQYQLPISD